MLKRQASRMAGLTREEAAHQNCTRLGEARRLKEARLEQEIRAAGLSPAVMTNLLHTLGKLAMFAADERDQLVRLGTEGRHVHYTEWLRTTPGSK